MTLPSRRKRPTIRPSIRRGMTSREPRVESREPETVDPSTFCILHFAFCILHSLVSLAIGLSLSLLTTSVSAGELHWRRGGPRHFTPTADSQPIAKSAQPRMRRDGAVRTVALEGEGPSFGAQQARDSSERSVDSNSMRSVVVDRDSVNPDSVDSSAENGALRSAQLQFRPPSEVDNRYNEQITQPFGQQPTETESTDVRSEEEISLPPENAAEPDLSPPPVDTGEVNLPDTTSRQPGSTEREPRTFQPAPPTNAPQSTPFVEDDEEPNAGLPGVDD